MIKLAFNLAKIAVFSVVILLIGQIPVGQKRISDHVRDITGMSLIQTPVNWIARKFDFAANGAAAPKTVAGGKNEKGSGRTEISRSTSSDNSVSDSSGSDRGRLSGLLKR